MRIARLMRRVRAALFRGDGTTDLRELPSPEPAAEGALLAVAAVELFGTDRRTVA
jgi:hypothetical protein